MGVNIHVGSPTLTVLPAFRHRAHRRPPLVGPAPGAGGLGQAGAPAEGTGRAPLSGCP